jgi:hypothetical protein
MMLKTFTGFQRGRYTECGNLKYEQPGEVTRAAHAYDDPRSLLKRRRM